jgi:hypothetical protein
MGNIFRITSQKDDRQGTLYLGVRLYFQVEFNSQIVSETILLSPAWA